MQITVVQKNVRQSPRKVRLVANSVKDLSLTDAVTQLSVIQRRASLVVAKVVRQAIANAVHNYGLAVQDLKLDTIQVQGGPTYKRFRAVSRGRAHKIFKRTCHVVVKLSTDAVKAPIVQPVATPAKQETQEKGEVSATAQATSPAIKRTVAPKASATSERKGAITASKKQTITNKKPITVRKTAKKA